MSSADDFFSRVGTQTKKDTDGASKFRHPYDDGAESESVPDCPMNTGHRWAFTGERFWQASDTCEKLEPGFYKLNTMPNVGPCLFRTTIATDGLIDIPDAAGTEVLEEFITFWQLKRQFNERGFLHKRGILLWGDPGSGKTATLMLMARDIVAKHGGIVCQIEHPGIAGMCLAMIRTIEPNRPIVALIEDMDAQVDRYGEDGFLSLLDGETQVDNICYIACPAPETLILKADLTWARADSLSEGDALIGFDEHGPDRKLRNSYVRSCPMITRERFRVTTEIGTTVVSQDHPFLVQLGNRPYEWRMAQDLNPGNRICAIGEPWTTDRTWHGGYLAGQFDGEGSLSFTEANEHGSGVISVEPIGPGPVVALDTTTNTFIGDGLFQHNTSNYPERLDKRFVDRPSRFDTIRWIGMPSPAARHTYLKAKDTSLSESDLNHWVELTEGFSIAHLRELVILVRCFGRPLEVAIARLDKMRLRRPSSEDSPDKIPLGFS